MGTSWYTFTHPNKTALYPLYTSLCTGELNAIRKQKCFSLQSFLRKGVSLGYVGSIFNLKDLKDVGPVPSVWSGSSRLLLRSTTPTGSA